MLTSKDKDLSDYIASHFTVAFQNVSEIEQAQVILIGETHGDKFHRDDNGALIDALYRPQDIVLVEAVPGRASCSRQVAGVKSNITVSAWDDPKRVEHLQIHSDKLNRLLTVNEVVKTSDNWIFQIGELLKLYPQNKSMDEDFFREQIENDFGHFSTKERHLLMNSLICNIAVEWLDFLISYVQDTFVFRNMHMLDQINTHYFPNRRVFAIAGLTHFISYNNFFEGGGEGSRGREILYNGLVENKYVVLIPKRNSKEQSYLLESIKKEWESSNWKQRAKGVTLATTVSVLGLALSPLIGVGIGISFLRNKLKSFHPSNFRKGSNEIKPLLHKYYGLANQFMYPSLDMMDQAEEICLKYNQVLPDDRRYFHNLLKN